MDQFWNLLSQSSLTTPLLLEAAARAFLVVVFAFLIVRVFRKRSAASRHLVWSCAAIGLVVIPALIISLPRMTVHIPASWRSAVVPSPDNAPKVQGMPTSWPLAATSASESIVPDARSAVNQTPAAYSNSPLSGETENVKSVIPPRSENSIVAASNPRTRLSLYVPLAWFFGGLITLSIPCTGLVRVHRLRRSAEVITDPNLLQQLIEIKSDMAIIRSVRLLYSTHTTMPFTWGVWRPIILLPRDSKSWSESRINLVFRHELAHIKRLDWLTQMIAQSACVLHWFNPLAWYVARRMNVERELACDDLVIATGGHASNYASELLHFAGLVDSRSALRFGPIPMARPSSLEQRILNIVETPKSRRVLTKTMIITALLVCSTFIPIATLTANAVVASIKDRRASHISAHGLSAFSVTRDGKVTYAFLFKGDFGSSTQFTSNRATGVWVDKATLRAGPSTIDFTRLSTTPNILTIGGKEYSLSNGRVFVITLAKKKFLINQTDRDIPVITQENIQSLFEKAKTPDRSLSPEEPVDPPEGVFSTTRPGTWKLNDKVTLTITETDIGKFRKVATATLNWSADGLTPALMHQVHIASNEHYNWAVAWTNKTSVMWICAKGKYQSRSSIRALQYLSPADIVTWSRFGDDHFDLGIPEGDDPAVSARRSHFSISAPLTGIPKDVERLLIKHMSGGKKMKYGISSLLPTGPYRAGGQHVETAITQDRWHVKGTVRNADGVPMPGVEVVARSEYHPTINLATTVTDANGAYSLSFQIDLQTIAWWRGLSVKPRKKGYVERSLGKNGKFHMLVTVDEDTQNIQKLVRENLTRTRFSLHDKAARPIPKFSESPAILATQTTADFVLDPAAQIEGTIMDGNGRPHSNAFISLRFAGQRQGYSVVSAGSDEQGKFQLTNVPVGVALDVAANRFQEPAEFASGGSITIQKPNSYHLKLTLDANESNVRLKHDGLRLIVTP